MAVIPVTPQDLDITGLTPVYTGSLSTSNTYTFPNDGRTFLQVKKSGAGSCVVTVTTPATYKGQAVADPTVTVIATTGDKMIGPFAPDLYNADGVTTVAYSEITGLTHGAFRLPAVN